MDDVVVVRIQLTEIVMDVVEANALESCRLETLLASGAAESRDGMHAVVRAEVLADRVGELASRACQENLLVLDLGHVDFRFLILSARVLE